MDGRKEIAGRGMTDAPFSLPPDYTLPTLEQRLDAAAAAAWCEAWGAQTGWDRVSQEAKRYWREETEHVCRAFAPEHFKAETGDVA